MSDGSSIEWCADWQAKTAARRIGVTLGEYRSRQLNGEKWCYVCRAWHPRSAFALDASRTDGLAARCRAAAREHGQSVYVTRDRSRGRRRVPARDGDRVQARRRIYYLVDIGVLPRPTSVPCVDCGDTSKPHEYDHHLGYAAEHHEHVEAVCSSCHHTREWARRKKVPT